MFAQFLFIASALLTVGSAIAVAVTKNIMHSCIFLLGSLLGIAGLYATLGADFVAVTQIMVYVGGVVILMLFAVMLTGGKDFVSRAQNLLGLAPAMGNKFTYAVGILVAIVFAATNIKILMNLPSAPAAAAANSEAFPSTVREIGFLLTKNHVLAFELSSVLLLGALVGAAIIARPKKH
ncbi:NADH-quinone oxidoreductase subunit J family protein [Peredibacter starrii]|uniref:NADH-quinone oxidoreductase subunit J n=1 Tax=Peredibacter starrii TaxID=28202 RepID=A0AAX4HQ59_9BACT|nr:NADH-quinone oxidoreductase subunit J [Peredibacter starrii]WPU65419.1 NADH-quinone oxidoreductase subunit J [Peredibacter starrii]